MTQQSCDDLQVVKADLSTVDDCPVLQKLKVFLVEQGTCRTLEWTLRDRAGNPVNLTNCFPQEGNSLSCSLGDEDSDGLADCGGIVVRMREIMSLRQPSDTGITTLWQFEGTVEDAENGIVRAALPDGSTAYPGLFLVNWGVKNEQNQLIYVSDSYLFVDRTLFGSDPFKVQGPPTLQEIRLSIRDSAPENLLLDNVEFDPAELALAIQRPVQLWNETPPPIEKFTTNTFPFKEHWLQGIQGYLFQTAAHSYRRNQFDYQAGGVQVDDKNKEQEYLRASQLLLEQYKTWLKHKKVEINALKAMGQVGSTYSTNYGF